MSALLLALGLALGPARAAEPVAPKEREPTRLTASGHLKTFGLVAFGRTLEGLPDDLVHRVLNPFPEGPTGQGIVDGRLNLAWKVGDVFRLEAAHAVTVFLDADGANDAANAAVAGALADDPLGALGQLVALEPVLEGLGGGGAGAGTPFSTGVGRSAPEAFPLTWRTGTDPVRDVQLLGRTDRLLAKVSLDGFDLVVGRQPVSFGSGLFFTPLDLVSPFTPATIDTEYKPGVDAVRVDGYFGTGGGITVVAAYTGRTYLHEAAAEGEPTSARVSVAGQGRLTVGVTDLSLFLGGIRGDLVAGASVVSALGPVGVHGDVAVTVPRPDLGEPVFVRAVIGADGRPTGTTTISGELYVQSFGSTDPGDLFERLGRERAQRGEVWLSGLAYAGLAISQEITPLWVASVGAFMNLTDPSALIAPSLAWSAAQNVDVALGGFVGVGAAPEGRTLDLDALPASPGVSDLAVVVPKSELGTYPASLYAKVGVYF